MTPSSLSARWRPTKERWLNPRSLSPPTSVTRPIFIPSPAFWPPVVVPDDFFSPPPPQPAARRRTTPSSASDLFIPALSAKVSDYGAKTVTESSTGHPAPAHVTLAVVLQVRNGVLQVLLWQRAKAPFEGLWALPGGYLNAGDRLEESIRRHLAQKVDIRELAHLEQLETLSDPTRVALEWQLATAYLGLVPGDLDPELPDDTRWHPVDRLPGLAFDHEAIVLAGRERLRAKLSYTNLGFALAPAEFTISELRDLYAAALGHDVSAPRFALPLPQLPAGNHRSVRRPAAARTCARPSRVGPGEMDLEQGLRRRVTARWRALEATSAPGSGAPREDPPPTSRRSSATTGRGLTAPRTWSCTTPQPRKTSPRRPSSRRCGRSIDSTVVARSDRGCTGLSSTGRSTGREHARSDGRSVKALSAPCRPPKHRTIPTRALLPPLSPSFLRSTAR